jgi:hypothetical protein
MDGAVTLTTTPVPAQTCPHCRQDLRAATSTAGATPSPDDLTICLYCATVLVFTPTMGLRRLTREDLDAMTPAYKAALWRERLVVQLWQRRN